MIIWAEIEVQLAVILSCVAAFKVLLQHLFPGFMDDLASGTSRTKTTRTPGTGAGSYSLQSRARSGFRTVTRIEAGGGTQVSKRQQADTESIDSRQHIVEDATAAVWPPRMKTTISVHSSKRESTDDDTFKRGSHHFAM